MKAFNKYFIIPAAMMFAFAACEDEKTPVLELVKKAGFNQFEKSEVVINKTTFRKSFRKSVGLPPITTARL